MHLYFPWFLCIELYRVCKLVLTGMTGRCERTCHEVSDGKMDYFDEIINDVMIRIERMMGRDGSPSVQRHSQHYQQWLKELERNTLRNRDQFTLLQHLLIYHTALVIKKGCRVKDALKFVADFHEKQREDKFTDTDHKLRKLYLRVCMMYLLGVQVSLINRPLF